MLSFLKSNPLLKKFLSFSFGSWIALVIGFISTPITTRLFSPEQLGKASMFNLAINVIMIFLVFGTDQAYVRFYYEEKEENRHLLLRNSISVPLLILGVITPFIFLFEKDISQFLFGEQLPFIGLYLVIGILFMLLQRFAVLVIRMKQQGKLFSYLQIAMKVVTLLFSVLFFLINGDNYKTVIWAQLVMLTSIALIALWYGRDQWRIDFSKRKITHTIKDIFKYSTPLVFTTLVMWLFQSFDRIAIKQFSDFTELGIYVAAFRVVVILNIIQTSFTTFWAPVSYEQYEKDPINTWFYERMHIIIAFAMLIVGTISIMGKDLITLLVGEKYRAASLIMPFLIFMPIMYTISETTVLGIGFMKKTKWSLIISIIVCMVNIGGNYWLVPILGGKGAAISTGGSYILFLYLRTFIGLRYYKVNFHLMRLTIAIATLVGYAGYSTMVEWGWWNALFGIVVLSIIGGLYYKPMMKVIQDK